MKNIIILFLLITACTAQVGKTLLWDYDYQSIHGRDIDSSKITFHIFHKDVFKIEFDSLANVSGLDTSYSIFNNHPEFYDNTRHYFYMTASDLDTFSLPSDTVDVIFSKDSPDKGYNFKINKK